MIVAVWIYSNVHPAIAYRAFGIVDGVIYSKDEPSALIDGQIVKEGDQIYGTVVAKIHPDKVEFDKNGKRWQQRVNQQPNPAWGESDSAKK